MFPDATVTEAVTGRYPFFSTVIFADARSYGHVHRTGRVRHIGAVADRHLSAAHSFATATHLNPEGVVRSL